MQAQTSQKGQSTGTGLGRRLARDWAGLGQGRDWDGTGRGLGRDWDGTGIGKGLARDWDWQGLARVVGVGSGPSYWCRAYLLLSHSPCPVLHSVPPFPHSRSPVPSMLAPLPVHSPAYLLSAKDSM